MMDRREFLKAVSKILVAVGGAKFFTEEELLALENGEIKKPDVIWLHGMSCDGCSTSLLNSEISIVDILTKYTNIIFHPTVMAGTGSDALKIIEEYNGDNLLFVLEGSIPLKMPHACMFGEEFIEDWVERIAKKAKVSVAAGTCAAFNGITDMQGMITGATTLKHFFLEKGINLPVINLPTCPMKPNHFVYVLFYYIKHGTVPRLDDHYRPVRFFGSTIHERCIYYNDFQERIFAKEIGDDGCLFQLGCQGIVTKNDCVKSTSFYDKYSCIKSGHPCVGCAGEAFPRTIMFKHAFDFRPIRNTKRFRRFKARMG